MKPDVAGASHVIHCCHCGGAVRVSRRAISVACPHCQQRVALETVVVSGAYTGRTLTTCADVIVEPSGRVNAPIRAQNVCVRGTVKAPIVASDRLVVEPSGRVYGDVQAARLDIADGAVVAGTCKIVPLRSPAPCATADPHGAAAAIPPSALPASATPSCAPVLRSVPTTTRRIGRVV